MKDGSEPPQIHMLCLVDSWYKSLPDGTKEHVYEQPDKEEEYMKNELRFRYIQTPYGFQVEPVLS
jgi:hypothetical protein